MKYLPRNLQPKNIEPEPEYLATSKKYLHKWAIEVNAGTGQPNVITMLGLIVGGMRNIPWFSGPGPMFTPTAAYADLALREVRELDPKLAALLVALAFDYSYQEIGNATGTNKVNIQRELGPAWGAFAMAIKAHLQIRDIIAGRPPRRMWAEDFLDGAVTP
jgi:hypothetical protein